MTSSSHLLTWESFEGSPLTSILPLAKRHNCDEEEDKVSLAMRIFILEEELPEDFLFNPFCFFLVLPNIMRSVRSAIICRGITIHSIKHETYYEEQEWIKQGRTKRDSQPTLR